MAKSTRTQTGFTLIEMSIVLVVIGLIVGGVLVGQDLIRAAEVRATISQIESYNTGTNTFYGKYQTLPGDMNAQLAQTYGFASRTGGAGEGDGNGFIAGDCGGPGSAGWCMMGEPLFFWMDLATAGLVGVKSTNAFSMAAAPNNYYPRAKMGDGLYVYIMGAYNDFSYGSNPDYVKNYFTISRVTQVFTAGYSTGTAGGTGITAYQAYRIDAKIDDGFPVSGRVIAASSPPFGGYTFTNTSDYSSYSRIFINDGTPLPSLGGGAGTPGGSDVSCFNPDAGRSAVVYSTTWKNGQLANCGLSIQFQ